MTDTLLWCADEQRNAVIAAPAHPLNGIDHVEYVRAPLAPPGQRHRIEVQFLKTPPAGLDADPSAFRVEGGIRVTGVTVLSTAAIPGRPAIAVFVDREGDFSRYVLAVSHPLLDPQRNEAGFSFKAGCPSEFDCRPALDCEQPAPAEPALDYLAKDYQSFRRLMLDHMRELDPGFTEDNPADLTVALVQLFASVGDYLSYWQDAAATEAFFDTCRKRASAARHARLIDQQLHNGRNAHGFVQFDGAPGVVGQLLAGVKLCTRITAPLRGDSDPPGLLLPDDADFDADPALVAATLFETAAPMRLIAARNLLVLHDWGDAACCLQPGATEAWLYATSADGADLIAAQPDFVAGEYLLLEEAISPRTGLRANADPRQRHVVRIEAVEASEDPAFRDRLVGGLLTARTGGQAALPLLHVRWRRADATPMPFRLSAEHPLTGQLIRGATIARGNVVPADHGRSVTRRFPAPAGAPALPALLPGKGRWPIDTQPIDDHGLTIQPMPEEAAYAPDGRLVAGRHDLGGDAGKALPALWLSLVDASGNAATYTPVRSLLDSGPFETHIVAEANDDGSVSLRFGDDVNGRRPGRPASAFARYRLGNGRAGNIGAGSLRHVVTPTAAELVDPANPGGPPLSFPGIAAIRQPLAASGGQDAQSVPALKALAPAAMRAETYRAVTIADWEQAALRLDGVLAARASFVWTGSWLTIFVALHPSAPESLVRLPGGVVMLEPGFAAACRAALNRYRIAGYDLAVVAAQYVPIELAVRLCVRPGHFRGDVLKAAADALSNRRLPHGATGFFHPSRFGFGMPVYLSRIHAALLAVEGVESGQVTVMKRYWDLPNGELARGQVTLGPAEIARLDNDINQPEFGVLRLSAVGGL